VFKQTAIHLPLPLPFAVLCIEPVTILLDLHVSIDDVPIGLSLQRCGPFKFSCNRLWIKPITDVDLPLSAVGSVLDTNVRGPTGANGVIWCDKQAFTNHLNQKSD